MKRHQARLTKLLITRPTMAMAMRSQCGRR